MCETPAPCALEQKLFSVLAEAYTKAASHGFIVLL